MKNKKRVVLIIGLPGSGKSTIAKCISNKYDIQLLSTEVLRAEYLRITKEESDCDFTDEQQEYVYSSIARIATEVLRNRDCVIIDGVFRSHKQRSQIYNALSKIDNLSYLKIWIQCNEAIEQTRLIERKKNDTICPAGIESYKIIKSIFEPPAIEENFIIIDNSSTLNSVMKTIYSIIEVYLL